MHELSIALSILQIARVESADRGNAPIKAIHIAVGPLSGVVTQALASAYEVAAPTMGFGDTRLVIEEMPVRIYFARCQGEQQVDSIQQLRCPICQTPSGDVVGGRELDITAMEIVAPPQTEGSNRSSEIQK